MSAPDEVADGPRRPIPDSYLIPNTRLVAGEYPGSRPQAGEPAAVARLAAFLDAGIDCFVDLTTHHDRLDAYATRLESLADARGADVVIDRLPIPDMGVCDAAHMRRILDIIDARLDARRTVYVHCWGGVGRTGTVVGCWLVRHGRTGEQALAEVATLFSTMSDAKRRAHAATGSPQTPAQRAMVRTWDRADRG
jgi:hypothetical protein